MKYQFEYFREIYCCLMCPCFDLVSDRCCITEQRQNDYSIIPKGCPLVEVQDEM